MSSHLKVGASLKSRVLKYLKSYTSKSTKYSYKKVYKSHKWHQKSIPLSSRLFDVWRQPCTTYSYQLQQKELIMFYFWILFLCQSRLVSGAAENIEAMLEWTGLPPDEGKHLPQFSLKTPSYAHIGCFLAHFFHDASNLWNLGAIKLKN